MLGLLPSVSGKKAVHAAEVEPTSCNSPLQGCLPRHLNERRGRGRMQKVIPNFFVGVRFTGLPFFQNASEVQRRIIEKLPQLQDAKQEPQKLHVTLCVMRLGGKDDVERAKVAMNAAHRDAKEVFDRNANLFEAHFQGVGTFCNKVLFAQPKLQPLDKQIGADALCFLHQIFARNFLERGMQLVDNTRAYKAHATLFKLSKLMPKFHGRPRGRGPSKKQLKTHREQTNGTELLRSIPEETFAEFRSFDFGSAKIERVQLCDMRRAQADGFYEVVHEVDLTASSDNYPI